MPISPGLLREYAGLNRRRRSGGITPYEFQRWLDLTQKLEKAFPGKPAPGSSGTTRLRVEFPDEHSLKDSAMFEMVPIGMFVATPFAAEAGTRFDLRLSIEATGERLKSQVIVASNNLGPGYSTQALGMGLRFSQAECALRTKLQDLCGIDATPEPEPEAIAPDTEP